MYKMKSDLTLKELLEPATSFTPPNYAPTDRKRAGSILARLLATKASKASYGCIGAACA